MGIIILSVILLLLFPLEFVCAVLYFPFAAIGLSRDELKESWIGSFPNTIWAIRDTSETIWEWIIDD